METKCHTASFRCSAWLQCQGTSVQPSGFTSCWSIRQWKAFSSSTCWSRPWPLPQAHQLQGQGGRQQLQISSQEQKENSAQEDVHHDSSQETSEAEEKGPKKPSEAKKDLPNPVRWKEDSRSQQRWGRLPPNQEYLRRRPPGKVARPKTKRENWARPERPPHGQSRLHRPLPVPTNQAGSQRSKAEGAAEMPRPTGKQKLRVRVQSSRSPRARMELLPHTKEEGSQGP